MNAGDTFLPPKPYNHLYMVISDPALDADNLVIVNFTTFSTDEEDSCVAQAGEHPFLTRKSCVRYKDGRKTSVAALNELVKKGVMKPHKPLSSDLLERVRRGAKNILGHGEALVPALELFPAHAPITALP